MIKELSLRIREYKKDSILAIVFVFFEVLTDIAIPFVMADLIDKGIEAGSMEQIFKIGGLLVAFSAGSLLFGVLSGLRTANAASGFGKNLRHDLFEKVQGFSFENIDKFSTSSLITRLTTDVNNIQQAYQMIIRTAIRSPLLMIFATLMAFRVKANLAMLYLVLIPVVGFGLYLIIRKVHPLFERIFSTYDELNSVVQENIHGIRVVKSYVQEDYEMEKFGVISNRIYKDFSTAEKILAFNNPVMQAGIYGTMLLISWFGAKMIVAGTMSTGALMSLVFYTMQILVSLMLLSMVFVMIVMARSGAERAVEILTEESSLSNPQEPVKEMTDSTIVFQDVGFSYTGDPDHLALSDVNVTIQPGETVGIIGGTGSSKTTLVQLIPRLYDVTTGTLTIGEIPVSAYDMDTLRQGVAMVLQKNVLFSGTIAENLRWGNENATMEQMQIACEQAQAAAFIDGFPQKYETYVEQGGANLSGGQRQRLCIARALLREPQILILDDSTSAVDTKTDARIRQALREDLPNTTKIIIAQRLASVEDADKIIVMEGGRVDGIGTHEELMESNQIYNEVYTSQNKGGLHE